MARKAVKDPDSTLDYGFDWAAWLGTDTIIASTWFSDAGLTLTGGAFDATKTTVWVAGGEEGVVYRLINRITTSQGRTDEKTLRLLVRDE